MNFDNLRPNLDVVIYLSETKKLNIQFTRSINTEIESEIKGLGQPFCSFFYFYPNENKIVITLNDGWSPLEVAKELARELSKKHNPTIVVPGLLF